MKKYKHGLFIGRFQPFHNGHAEVIRQMDRECEYITIIIGSAWCRPNFHRNPFDTNWRQQAITDFLIDNGIEAYVAFVEDSPYDDQRWASSVEEAITEDTVMYCHEKEDTTYFKFFPDVKKVFVKTAAGGISATDIRQMIFSGGDFAEHVPPNVAEMIHEFQFSDAYQDLVQEKKMIEAYKAPYASLPYPPSFNTGDAVVTCKGRVLMIKRGQFPAKGSMALPGGFLNVSTDASMVDCALRELKEETRIKIPPAVLRGSIKQVRTFDHMHRDPRGRIITTAVHIDVTNEVDFPWVKAADDASEALWVPRHKIFRQKCFGDHYDIIDTMIGLK